MDDIFEVCEDGDEQQLDLFFNALKEQENGYLIVNSKNSNRYYPLHVAIFARNLAAIERLLSCDADVNAKCYGTPPCVLAILAASMPDGKEFGLKCFQLLIEHPQVNPFAKDDNGFSALHFAAKYDLTEAILSLFKIAEAGDLVNSVSKSGATPLHLAASTDALESLQLLLENGANPKRKLHLSGMMPIHVAAHYNSQKCLHYLLHHGHGALTDSDGTQISVEEFLRLNSFPLPDSAPQSTVNALTGIYSSLHCLNHHTCPDSAFDTSDQPPENVHRLEVLLDKEIGALYSQEFAGRLTYHLNGTTAPIGDILRVHEWSYVRNVEQVCGSLAHDHNDEDEGIGKLDGDTTISRGTYRAALAAVGAVCSAIDQVMKKQIRNAFCPIRPPGHHAGPRGAVGEGASQSHGFCIFNNVSCGAAYVMNRYREQVKKVVIVDFDVHHGNGTEETVRWLKPAVDKFPITCELVTGSLMAPRFKPWYGDNDAEHVLFISVHGYGPRARGYEQLFPLAAFYPGSGATTIPEIPLDSPSSTSSRATLSDPLILDIGVPLPKDQHPLITTKETKVLEELEVRLQWRNYFRQEIFPKIMQFAPNFMIISAGFDAHKRDTINAGYISIIEEDFGWITDHLVYIANSCCEGRIVSALEGGYQIGGEYSSAFAKSVQSHVHSLVRGSTSKREYDEEYNHREQAAEQKYLEKVRQQQEKEIAKERERLLRLQQQQLEALQAQREQQSEQMEEVEEEREGVDHSAVREAVVDAVEANEESTGRKRRRTAVDYVALDQELRKQQQQKE